MNNSNISKPKRYLRLTQRLSLCTLDREGEEDTFTERKSFLLGCVASISHRHVIHGRGTSYALQEALSHQEEAPEQAMKENYIHGDIDSRSLHWRVRGVHGQNTRIRRMILIYTPISERSTTRITLTFYAPIHY